MKTEIYLVRHGQTEWNLQKRYQGSGDSPLTELGIKQAKALSKKLNGIHFDAICCSPAGRAHTTAQIINADRNLEIAIINDFQEINVGKWEGCLYEKMKNDNPELYHGFWESPDLFILAYGETFSDVAERVHTAFLKIIEENTGKRILIVSHAVTLKSLLNKINGVPLNRFWENKLYQTSLSIIEANNNEFTIVKYGDFSHLELLENK